MVETVIFGKAVAMQHSGVLPSRAAASGGVARRRLTNVMASQSGAIGVTSGKAGVATRRPRLGQSGMVGAATAKLSSRCNVVVSRSLLHCKRVVRVGEGKSNVNAGPACAILQENGPSSGLAEMANVWCKNVALIA